MDERSVSRGADRRAGRGTRGMRDRVKYPLRRAWVHKSEDEWE